MTSMIRVGVVFAMVLAAQTGARVLLLAFFGLALVATDCGGEATTTDAASAAN